jgi:hypothetical protein
MKHFVITVLVIFAALASAQQQQRRVRVRGRKIESNPPQTVIPEATGCPEPEGLQEL